MILTLRPIFFLAIKSYLGGDMLNVPRDIYQHEHITFILECTNAARRNLRLGRHILMRCNHGATTPGKPIMVDLHHIFNAAVIMLLYQLVFTSFHSSDEYALRFARKTFEREAQTECLSSSSKPSGMGIASVPTGYASDCLGVLNGLTEVVERLRPLRFKDAASIDEAPNHSAPPLAPPSPILSPVPSPVQLPTQLPGLGLEGGDGSEDEDLEAKLAFPVGMDGLYSPVVFPGLPPLSHTHAKEFRMWMDGETRTRTREGSTVWSST
jgi:hypothetical protein